MFMHSIDYVKERDGDSKNLLHHQARFAHLSLPENPVCWLFGHTPFVYRLPLRHKRPDGETEYRWVECKVCGRRSTRHVPSSPKQINYKDFATDVDRRTGWQGRDVSFAAETVIRNPVPEASARFHLGSRGSETPVDIHLSIAGTGIYLNTSLGSRTADIITHSTGREVKLSLFEGSLYWKLWVDEDHSCSGSQMRRFGGKYRSWLCRSGSLSVRPMDYVYGGSPSYSYQDVEGPTTVLLVTSEGTEHNVDLTLQKQRLSRPKGPYTESWVVKWDCTEGIPVRDNDWKGDCFYGSAVKVDSENDWVNEALWALRADVTSYRQRYQWTPKKTSETTT